MAVVADHLVPADGLTDSSVEFVGFDVDRRSDFGAADVKFEIRDEQDNYLGTFNISVGPTPAGTIDAMVAEGHARMRDVLRQWLFEIDRQHQVYAKK